MNKNLKGIMATASMLALVLTLTQDVGAANTVTAIPSTHTFSVDGEIKPMAAYVINGNNYLKLRDIAAVVNGTPKQFEVGWDAGKNAINLTSNKAYTPNGNELTKGSGGAVTAQVSTAKVYKDSALANYAGYNIAGNNYYKLRDVVESFDIGVEWDGATMTSNIVTGQVTGNQGDNNQNQGSNQAEIESTMKTVSNNPSYSYDVSLISGSDMEGLSLEEQKAKFDSNAEQLIRTWELAMVDLVNEERRNAGLNELVIDEELRGFSQYWAQYLTTDFRHAAASEHREYTKTTNLSEEEAEQRIVNVGENIGMISLSDNPVKWLMQSLMLSPGHKAAILNEDYKTIGIGFAVDNDGAVYCCQNFGRVFYEN